MPRNPVFRIQVTIVKQKGRAQRCLAWILPAALLPACPMLGQCWQKAWGREAARSMPSLPLAWHAPCKRRCWLCGLGRAAGSRGRCPESHANERVPGQVCIHWAATAEHALLTGLAENLARQEQRVFSSDSHSNKFGGSFMSSCCWWPRLGEAFGAVPPDLIRSPRNGCFPAFLPSSTFLLSRAGAFWVEEQLARLDQSDSQEF